MASITLNGSCLCNQLRYQLTGSASNFFHCHCSRCRKASGTGHASNIIFNTDKIDWQGDTALLGSYKVPEGKTFTSTFCKNCGSSLPWVVEGAPVAIVPAGTLDDPVPLKPNARIFWESRSDWCCSDDDIPCFETFPKS
jgi:hypothetical protein